jgi:uncharacterized protein YbjQ (UPF0145 family)
MNRTSAQNVLVSTTPGLDGWDITRYHGAVSAHVVAGTNIFSDIAASWRDVFGGQSKSYKKQLEQINEKVVGELKEEASQRGANALVGLQIDHDQISGQQKEMFMVTASATAVRADPPAETEAAESSGGEGSMTARETAIEERTVRLLQKNQEDNLRLDDETWRFLIENQVTDFGQIVQTTLTGVLTPGGPLGGKENHLSSGQDYFLSIPEEKAKEHLYDMARHEDKGVMEWAIDVLENGNLLDLGRISTMLEGDFYADQKPALEILTRVDKPYYEQSDIERLKALKSRIEDGFGKQGEVLEVENSGMLSSGTEEVWQIEDGTHNPMDKEYCKATGLDIYGFGRKDTRPEDAVQALETKIAALNRRLDS